MMMFSAIFAHSSSKVKMGKPVITWDMNDEWWRASNTKAGGEPTPRDV